MRSPATSTLVSPFSFNISRRRFLQSAGAALAVSTLGADAADILNQKPRRVGLIGTGWYGKSDLWRLIQVAPVEVVSLCDADKHMLAEAAEMASQRQNRKGAAHLHDYREMLKEKDLDIVLIGTPDHWHALQMIAAVESVPTSTCRSRSAWTCVEGEAMLAAARKHNRVVQVGTQRKSTPHLIDAKKQVVEAGLLGKDRPRRNLLLLPHARQRQSAGQPVPDFLDYEMWTGPAPLRPYDGLPHKRWWRTFMEYGNGIVGDMCVHMFDTARWMLGLGWPKRDQLRPAAFSCRRKASRTSRDTQTATFEYDEFNVVWQHRTWGAPPDPELSVGAHSSTAKRNAQGQHHERGLHPARQEGEADPQRLRLREASSSRKT